MTTELSLPSIPNPAYMEVDDKAIGFLPHYEGHPPISIAEFGKIVDRLHANDNYMFSQEYDVRGGDLIIVILLVIGNMLKISSTIS